MRTGYLKAGKKKNWAWIAPLSVSDFKGRADQGHSGRAGLVSGGHCPFAEL